ncbi:MAG: carboxypeptidase regulatory-like domain-containing protein, partial [Acidobacteria bacterium]|nr:carboxypeptidase regulatory-like domain-containing protein [Acidobacteriota bacterium]
MSGARSRAAILVLSLGTAAGWAAAPAGEGGALEKAPAVLLGTVRDSAGTPVAGARVRLRSYRGTAGWHDGSTDAQGRYRIEGIEPEETLVWVELGDFISTDSQVITVAAGLNSHDLLCPRREIRGRVLSPEGRPVAGATVALHQGGGGETRRSQKTDPDGLFSFMVLDGWYSIFTDAPGFVPAWRDTPLRVHGTSRSVEIRVWRDTAIPARGAAIRGRVTGLSPGELAAVKVYAYLPGKDLPLSATPDPAGRYRIADVEPPGEWSLVVETASKYDALKGDASKKLQRLVKVPPGPAGRTVDAVDFAFPEYFAVSGRVLNADGSLSELDRVSFDDPRQADSHETRIGPQGSFSIALPSGSYRIEADNLSDELVNIGALAWAPVLVEGKPRHDIEIRLDATGTISGRLLGGAAGDRMSDMTVRAYQGHLAQDGKVDENGHFEIAGLFPGRWQVTAWSGSGDITAAKVSLPEDVPRASVDLSFRPGRLTLSGRLAGFDPAAQYNLKIERADDRYDSHVIGVEHDGTFSRSGLVAGTYRLEVGDSEMP